MKSRSNFTYKVTRNSKVATKFQTHSNRCPAPICPFDVNLSDNLNTWCWYPDELVCQKGPYTHIQKIQTKIHKLYLKGKINKTTYFNVEDLMKIKSVRAGIKGRNPNRRHSTPLDLQLPLNHG